MGSGGARGVETLGAGNGRPLVSHKKPCGYFFRFAARFFVDFLRVAFFREAAFFLVAFRFVERLAAFLFAITPPT